MLYRLSYTRIPQRVWDSNPRSFRSPVFKTGAFDQLGQPSVSSGGEIRTLTGQGLNLLPLPVGLRRLVAQVEFESTGNGF